MCDKITGKLLPMQLSPHISHIQTWLAANQGYEPVKPGTPQAESIMSKKQAPPQAQPSPAPAQSPVKVVHNSAGDDLFSNPVKIITGATPVLKKAPTQGQHSGISGSVRSNVSVKTTSSSAGVRTAHVKEQPKPANVTSSSSKTQKVEPKKLKTQHSEEKPSSSSLSSKLRVENDRMMIRNTLRDTLSQRMQEFDHPDIPKMTQDEVVDFAKEVEREMYLFFNKEIREKYKSKYRSLKFNLSDVKNKTLLERICAKKLTPKQLVELPAAALASEELSKWREYENKHQLEIITKSELDALAQTKIVVKTHKGEEIIETKSAPVDILVPIDDVESVIAKNVLNVEDQHSRYDLSRSISLNVSGGNASSPLSSPSITSSTGRKSDNKHRSRSRSKSRGRDHHHHHKSSSSSKHKKSDRHRSRSPRNHSSRDKDRKSGEKSRERSKSKKSDEHRHHRDKSREKDKLNTSKSKDSKPKESKDSKNHQKTEEKPDVKSLNIEPDQQDVDLVGKILGSMGVHLDKPPTVPKVEEKPKDEIKPKIESAPFDILESIINPVVERTKLVEIYSGNIHMADVAKFSVTGSIVSGNFENIPNNLPSQLDIVGQIEPDVVCKYLDKIKKSPTRESCVMRFTPTDESKAGYTSYFNNLNSKKRYGVIKFPSSKIKDFYLIPVAAGDKAPNILLPFVGPGFIEGEKNKPDMFLGVIVKILPVDEKVGFEGCAIVHVTNF